jgi:glutamine amidotransferase
MIAIIDYDAGNLRSVQKAYEHMGVDCKTTSCHEEILKADAVILPGVGAFSDCMQNLTRKGMDGVVKACIEMGKPFLGICLGYQMLFEYSEEHPEGEPDVKGLGIFKGCVRRFPGDMGLKVPHMGWNNLKLEKDCPLFADLPEDPFVYFVHSYYVEAADRSIVSARVEYGRTVDAAISSGNVFAMQFHPEKSGEAGLKIIQNFVKAVYHS